MITVRDARPEDCDALAELWAQYLEETYALRGTTHAHVLRRDAFGPRPWIRLAVAVGPQGELRGAAAWRPGYDVHHFVRGVDLLDLYVCPAHRGRGVAVQLLAHVAARGRDEGAEYMRGGLAATGGPAERLYDRTCVFFEGRTANLSARAFRHLASLAGADARTLCRSLPERAWNHEP
ncbi:MAG: GNAT family N-acetyltransferase [Myxococcales bacterium]|nr:GNAT family N-acetyltransferase [Myxococcales bacterium]